MEKNTIERARLFKILGALAFATYIINTLGNPGIWLVGFAAGLVILADILEWLKKQIELEKVN